MKTISVVFSRNAPCFILRKNESELVLGSTSGKFSPVQNSKLRENVQNRKREVKILFLTLRFHEGIKLSLSWFKPDVKWCISNKLGPFSNPKFKCSVEST